MRIDHDGRRGAYAELDRQLAAVGDCFTGLVAGHALLELAGIEAGFNGDIEQVRDRITRLGTFGMLGEQLFLIGPVAVMIAGTAGRYGRIESAVTTDLQNIEEHEAHIATR